MTFSRSFYDSIPVFYEWSTLSKQIRRQRSRKDIVFGFILKFNPPVQLCKYITFPLNVIIFSSFPTFSFSTRIPAAGQSDKKLYYFSFKGSLFSLGIMYDFIVARVWWIKGEYYYRAECILHHRDRWSLF